MLVNLRLVSVELMYYVENVFLAFSDSQLSFCHFHHFRFEFSIKYLRHFRHILSPKKCHFKAKSGSKHKICDFKICDFLARYNVSKALDA